MTEHEHGSEQVHGSEDDAAQVLRSIWGVTGQTSSDLDHDCGPTKPCKNMAHVSFDGMAEPGSDLRDAWRDRLRREGKLSTSGDTVRELVLGSGDQR